jgi:hypothetical protein
MTRLSILAFASLAFAGCSSITEWGYKMPTGPDRYASVPAERVDVLFVTPSRPFKQIGIVSAMGGTFSSDVAMDRKLQKAAADLGADAVIIVGQSQGIMTAPGLQTTIAYSNTTGTVGAGSLNAQTTTTATTVGAPAMTFGYPKSQGIAIKYTN